MGQMHILQGLFKVNDSFKSLVYIAQDPIVYARHALR